jgi:hypothetical protein
MAHNYCRDGRRPRARTRQHHKLFLLAMSFVLPCPRCGQHFRAFLLEDERLERALHSREGLVRLLVDAHNHVNAHTRPEQPPFEAAEAERLYASFPLCFTPPAQRWPRPP